MTAVITPRHASLNAAPGFRKKINLSNIFIGIVIIYKTYFHMDLIIYMKPDQC